MTVTFDTHGNIKQKQAAMAWVDNNTTDILYGGGKGGGKTYLGVSLIFGDALLYPGTHYFIARKELNDLRRFTIPSIYEVFNDLGLDPNLYLQWHGQDNFFELPNGSKVFLLAAKYLPGDPKDRLKKTLAPDKSKPLPQHLRLHQCIVLISQPANFQGGQ